MKFILPSILLIITTVAEAQFKIRTVDELVNYANPGWKTIRKRFDTAINKVEIMPVDTMQAREAVYQIQIGTESPIGTITYMTGGILFEDGWLRLLGSGSHRLTRSISSWNKGKTFNEVGERPPYLLIADDALGGFFALNTGGLGNDIGKVYYLAPATLLWEGLDMSVDDFLHFCCNADFEEFYKPYISKNWHYEVTNLPADKCYNYTPPLWSKEGKKFTKSIRKYISVEEQYNYNIQMRSKLGLDEEEEDELKLAPKRY